MLVVFFSCLALIQLIWDPCDIFMAVMVSDMIVALLLSGYVAAALKGYKRRRLQSRTRYLIRAR